MLGDREKIATGAMARAWRHAARDLGIRFDSPFAIELRGTIYWCAGLLPDFGCERGAIIAGRDSLDSVFVAADGLGFFASGLNPEYYERYERALFVETLNDWGWFGEPAAVPSWFTGGLARHGG